MKLPIVSASQLSLGLECELPEDWEGTALDILSIQDQPLDFVLWDAVRSAFLSEDVRRQFNDVCKIKMLERINNLKDSAVGFLNEFDKGCTFEEFLAGYVQDMDAALLTANSRQALSLATCAFTDPEGDDPCYNEDALESLVSSLKELIAKNYEVSI